MEGLVASCSVINRGDELCLQGHSAADLHSRMSLSIQTVIQIIATSASSVKAELQSCGWVEADRDQRQVLTRSQQRNASCNGRHGQENGVGGDATHIGTLNVVSLSRRHCGRHRTPPRSSIHTVVSAKNI